MRRVEKSKPPKGWVEIEQQLLSWLREERRSREPTAQEVRAQFFDRTDTSATNESLLAEQHHLCVFCETRLRYPPTRVGESTSSRHPYPSDPRRAHWVPVAIDKERSMDWKNVYASCSRRDTCDNRQGPADLGLPAPCDWPAVDWLVCGSDGVLKLSKNAPQGYAEALNRLLGARTDKPARDVTTHLNHPRLCDARRAAIDETMADLEKRFPARHATDEEREMLARELLAENVRPVCISARVWYLRRRR